MKITLKSEKTGNKIKPLHGVDLAPIYGMDFSMMHYLTEAGIPFVRTHDFSLVIGSSLGSHVIDVPLIFTDFSADPADPDAYDFAFTDQIIRETVKTGTQVFYRLGVSIENHHKVKAYHIFPPKDNEKWAKICEGIIRHYNEGWANGFNYGIKYWEIWNEPDGSPDISESQMWKGTAEEYYALYVTASKYLKACFPDLKIGGYASCGFYGLCETNGWNKNRTMRYYLDFFDGFLKTVKENKCPLDFFSWHSYASIKDTEKFAYHARRRLDEEGFTDTITSCNEWNIDHTTRGSIHHAAQTAGMMLAMQEWPLDQAMFYDARFGVSMYGGVFNPLTRKPFPTYYSLCAFNELYVLGDQLALDRDALPDGVYAEAATNGAQTAFTAANTSGAEQSFELEYDRESFGDITECRIIDGEHVYECVELPKKLGGECVLCVKFAK